ncbi:MAG: hypothetical protein C6I00_00480 [Nitratiruptor sp.]|nr:hypothetical protein [Nitratiruptor sp.]NPA84318.1 CinA family protein [Campylobacterota bacterium]
MRHIVIFIGKEFLVNEAFVAYVRREARKRLIHLHTSLFFNERNKDIFVEIARAQKEYDAILIVASPMAYATAAKVVATIFEDNLELREGMLLPSRAERFVPDSFRIGNVNLLKASTLQKLPPILLESELESTNLFIWNMEPEEIEGVIGPIAAESGVEYILTPLTHQLYQVHLVNRPEGSLLPFLQEVKERLEDRAIVASNLFEYLIDHFSAVGKSLTFAESCTGGLLASMLTSVPGSSNIFKGSLVTYANEMKSAWLGVREETLQAFGAVSEEVVEEMLSGALKIAQADYAIAISGVAGPGGGSPVKPVGTVVVGARGVAKEQELIRRLHFEGDRNYIQYQAAMYGIKLLFEVAKEELY